MEPKANVYPCTIVKDRYGGGYSGGAWLAFYADVEVTATIEFGGGDTDEMNFWDDPENSKHVGKGDSPNAAYEDLQRKLGDLG